VWARETVSRNIQIKHFHTSTYVRLRIPGSSPPLYLGCSFIVDVHVAYIVWDVAGLNHPGYILAVAGVPLW
jgi:hypothetical protein